MPLIAYLDEAGNPALDAQDSHFPLFALSLVVFETHRYSHYVVPSAYHLKLQQWGHEGVVLHSRDIRLARGPFAFLRDAERRQPFYEQINTLVQGAEMTVLTVVVRKEAHRALHGTRARDPYDLALRFAVERLVLLLEDAGQSAIRVIAEARGKREDQTLRRHLTRLLRRGTSTMTADRFSRVNVNLEFLPKSMNVIGTQLADLVTYPIARHVLHPQHVNPAFDIVEPKLCRRRGERIGLAIYPGEKQTASGNAEAVCRPSMLSPM